MIYLLLLTIVHSIYAQEFCTPTPIRYHNSIPNKLLFDESVLGKLGEFFIPGNIYTLKSFSPVPLLRPAEYLELIASANSQTPRFTFSFISDEIVGKKWLNYENSGGMSPNFHLPEHCTAIFCNKSKQDSSIQAKADAAQIVKDAQETAVNNSSKPEADKAVSKDLPHESLKIKTVADVPEEPKISIPSTTTIPTIPTTIPRPSTSTSASISLTTAIALATGSSNSSKSEAGIISRVETPDPKQTSKDENNSSLVIIIILSVCAGLSLLLSICGFVYIRRRNTLKKISDIPYGMKIHSTKSSNELSSIVIAGELQNDEKYVNADGSLREKGSKTKNTEYKTIAGTNCLLVSAFNNLNISHEKTILDKIKSSLKHSIIYNDLNIQDNAREYIPIDDLHAKSTLDGKLNEYMLLKQLLKWFKNEFFTWVNSPLCSNNSCANPTSAVGISPPIHDEIKHGASVVELYKCNVCNLLTRFPRYNDPIKLLQTRKGRCGEWANAFTLCCSTLGFETRYVLDFTDHVWTEVFLSSENRWIHLDSCEEAIDQPLMYESGWGKKLTFVIALNHLGVVDVTPRYTRQLETIIQRRNVDEEWFGWVLKRWTEKSRMSLNPTFISELKNRDELEQSELLEFSKTHETNLKDQEKNGRISGSLAWRRARGEHA